ncbi:MAG: CHC2 zinc finger domain-containing protein, partial [Gammaproteobacteria bacterium]
MQKLNRNLPNSPSNFIPQSFISDLLARCDLIEIIDARIPLKKAGHSYTACCPFHNEKTPSFNVSRPKQVYHCFGCGASGNVIGFLMAYEHIDFVSAIEVLAAHAGVEVPREQQSPERQQQRKKQQDLYTQLEHSTLCYQKALRQFPPAIDYLKQRGVTGEIAKQFRIGYAALAGYDRFRERVIFPIRDQRGRVIGFGGRVIKPDQQPKYLNSSESPIFQKNKELYGLYEAQQACRNFPRIVVVEGYMDVIMLAQHHIPYAVATMGTATSTLHLQRLAGLTNEVVFCFDGDNAGRTAAWRALENALPMLKDGIQIRFLLLPEKEDPDSLVQQEGTEKFIERVNNATALPDFFFQYLLSQINLAHLDGRARLANIATPLIQKIPEGVYQQLMLDKLANFVRIDVHKLQQPVRKTMAKAQPTFRMSPMRLAIALVLQNPHLASTVQNHAAIYNLTLRGSKLLNELLIILDTEPNLSAGGILEYWRNKPEYDQ